MGQSLITAASDGNEKAIKKLLAGGSSANEGTDSKGCGPLYCACRSGHPGCTQALILAGADLSAREPRTRRTPLHAAAKYGNTECTRLLLIAGASPNSLDMYEQSPLHMACLHNRVGVVQLLIEFKAEISVKNGAGQTPLHWAAGLGHYLCVELLLDAGAKILVEDDSGDTPLHRAAEKGQLECARLMLRTCGPDVLGMENKTHKTPYDLAKANKFHEVSLLLDPNLSGGLARVMSDSAEDSLGASARASLASSGLARRSLRIDSRMVVSTPERATMKERHKSLVSGSLVTDDVSRPFSRPVGVATPVRGNPLALSTSPHTPRLLATSSNQSTPIATILPPPPVLNSRTSSMSQMSRQSSMVATPTSAPPTRTPPPRPISIQQGGSPQMSMPPPRSVTPVGMQMIPPRSPPSPSSPRGTMSLRGPSEMQQQAQQPSYQPSPPPSQSLGGTLVRSMSGSSSPRTPLARTPSFSRPVSGGTSSVGMS